MSSRVIECVPWATATKKSSTLSRLVSPSRMDVHSALRRFVKEEELLGEEVEERLELKEEEEASSTLRRRKRRMTVAVVAVLIIPDQETQRFRVGNKGRST